MKKIAALFMALALSLGLAACDGSHAPKQDDSTFHKGA